MLPKTQMATSTEVEGNTTVEVTGTNSQGVSLKQLQADDLNNQTADPIADEAKTGEAEQSVATAGSEAQPTEKPPRTERRMEKLIDKLKERTDEVDELRRLKDSLGQQPVAPPQPQLPPWMQGVPQGEISLDDYRAQVADTARGLVQSELSSFQGRVVKYENYKDDLTKVENKYPILNPDSESYDRVKAKTVAQYFQKAQQGDPKLRLSDFVDSIMSFHQAGRETGQMETKSSVVMREAEAAVAPSQAGSNPPSSGGQDWESMSLKEKESWMKSNGFWD